MVNVQKGGQGEANRRGKDRPTMRYVLRVNIFMEQSGNSAYNLVDNKSGGIRNETTSIMVVTY